MNRLLIMTLLSLLLAQAQAQEHSNHSQSEASHEGHNHNQHDEHEHDEHEHDSNTNQVSISDQLIEQYGVKTVFAFSEVIKDEQTFYGVIKTPQDKMTIISAPYQSRVSKVYVTIGEKIKKGQTLLKMVNIKNLQSYFINSPVSGLLVERLVNNGEIVQQDSLLKVANLSKVWVDFTVFPKQLAKLNKISHKRPIMKVSAIDDQYSVESRLSYILPTITGGHLAKARGVIDNKKGVWVAGMHVKVTLVVSEKTVDLAVKNSAIQTLNGQTVVFVKEGSGFSAREVKTGVSDGQFIEILSGLNMTEEYVSRNSFLMKADLMKHDAAHAHSH